MAGLLDYLSEKYRPQTVKEINERLVELSSLFEISQILNSSLELDNVLNNIMLIPMGRMMVARGAVFVKKGVHFSLSNLKGLPKNLIGTDLTINHLPAKPYWIIDPEDRNADYAELTEFMSTRQLSLLIPLKTSTETVGFILYGRKLNNQPFYEVELDFLQSLANISATSVDNALRVDEIKTVNKQLDQRIQQLKTLFDINQGLSATLDNQKIIKLLTYAFMGQMLVNHYAILMKNGNGLMIIESKGFNPELLEIICTGLQNYSNFQNARLTQTLPSGDLTKRLNEIGARVIIPMLHQNEKRGYILLGKKISKETYSEIDLEFLTTLVSQAVISLENARLFRETLEMQRMEQELQVAQNIQNRMLPSEIPVIREYDVFGINIPSKQVGGDYYDVIKISDDEFAVAIGDVSGKSVPAALLMANVQAGLRSLISEDIPLSHIVERLNNLIYQNTDLDKYITFFVGILNRKKHQLRYVNAGHNPPFLLQENGEKTFLEHGGIILGMMPGFQYETGSVDVKEGELFVCYTDGVNEAMNTSDEEFGEERLYQIVVENHHLSAKALSEKIVQSVKMFSAEAPQYDDVTLLIVKRP